MAILSILSLYNYDSSIFDNLVVPSHVDKPLLVKQLVFDLAELDVVYSEPTTLKYAIGVWSQIHLKEWQDLQDTLEYDYNPIWNVDATEVETRDLDGFRKDKESGKDTVTNSGTDTNTHSVMGYQSTLFADADKDSFLHGLKSETEYGHGNQTDYEDNGSITKTRGGNIGVTATQDLINKQREVVQFNVTDYIIKQFKNQYCIMCY